MKKIFTSQDITLVNFYKSILEDNGIHAVVKNYYLTSGAGDIPANECIPELWIINDEKLDEARELLSAGQAAPWQCECGERIGGQFVQCWKCARLRDNTK
jgi:hypothetical protein